MWKFFLFLLSFSGPSFLPSLIVFWIRSDQRQTHYSYWIWESSVGKGSVTQETLNQVLHSFYNTYSFLLLWAEQLLWLNFAIIMDNRFSIVSGALLERYTGNIQIVPSKVLPCAFLKLQMIPYSPDWWSLIVLSKYVSDFALQSKFVFSSNKLHLQTIKN